MLCQVRTVILFWRAICHSLILLDLKWYRTINFIQNTQIVDVEEDAAKICGHLLNQLKEIQPKLPNKSVYDRYQIVLQPIRKGSTLCQLFLRVYPLQWYNYEKGKDEHIEEKADYHIEQVNKEKDQDNEFLSDRKPYYSDELLENYYECSEKVLVHEKWKEPCGFFVKEDYRIYETNEFYVAARFNGCPIITICPDKHCQNEDWLKTSDAWHAVREVLQYIQNELGLNELPLCRIYVNFGKWHSQNHNGRVNGHAHINIVLTKEAIERCKK
jgi:hypothetical protein